MQIIPPLCYKTALSNLTTRSLSIDAHMDQNAPVRKPAAPRSPAAAFASATLEFVPPMAVDGYMSAARRLAGQGKQSFSLRASSALLSLAGEIQRRIAGEFPEVQCSLEELMGRDAPQARAGQAFCTDVVFLLETSANALSAALMDFIDVPVSIVAPITDHYFRRRALHMITVPKSGTHMLFELLSAFNLTNGGPAQEALSPQHFYFLSPYNTHTVAREFLRELVGLPLRGADHPFFATPALFMYRNPLDVVVSEAFYCRDPEKSPVARALSSEFGERLLQLIGDDPLQGTLRIRMRRFEPWLRMRNVIPISFEELVGPDGGGTLIEQLKTIWSLQLKLHIPGSPAFYAAAVFCEQTNTFRKGAINSHLEFFTDSCYAAVRKLDQDFMHEFGYDIDDRFLPGYLPRHVERFRKRRLELTEPARSARPRDGNRTAPRFPAGAVIAYRGHLAAQVSNVCCALPREAQHPVDPRLEAGGHRLKIAATWEKLLHLLDAQSPGESDSPPAIVPHMTANALFRTDPRQPALAVADMHGFAIVEFDNRFYCVNRARGPVDVQWGDTTGIYIAATLDEARVYCQPPTPAQPLPAEPPSEAPSELPAGPRGVVGWMDAVKATGVSRATTAFNRFFTRDAQSDDERRAA